MTIDERLEQLIERHEALTQSIELMHHDMAEMLADSQALKEATSKIADAARAHQLIAEAHERRLDKIDVVVDWLAQKERTREKEGMR